VAASIARDLRRRGRAQRRRRTDAGFGRGVFKSTDGGERWALKNAGIDGGHPLAWRLARDTKGTLYVVVARRSDDGSFANAGDGAVYRSTDGAERLTRLRLPRA